MHGRYRWWDLRAQADDGTGGAGGGGTVDAAQAREFLAPWAPDPEALKALPDDRVVAWHGSVTKNLTAAQKDALDKHDWRKDMAGDDAERMKTLERMASPKAVYDSYDQLRSRLSKGELKAVGEFPAKGTTEQQAQWRAENDVPESPDKYDIKLSDGLVLGEADKPMLEGFRKYAHENNIGSKEVNSVANWYFKDRAEREVRAHADYEQKKLDTAAELGNEWGPEYKPTLNKIQGLLDATIPTGDDGEQLKGLVNNAIATNPLFARHYAQIALQVNPAGTMVPGDRGANESSVTDALKQISADMKKDRSAYNKDTAKQERFVQLAAAYERMTGKAWSSQG